MKDGVWVTDSGVLESGGLGGVPLSAGGPLKWHLAGDKLLPRGNIRGTGRKERVSRDTSHMTSQVGG